MKAIFGVLALVIVLAIVSSLVRKELSTKGLAARSSEAASQAAALGATNGSEPATPRTDSGKLAPNVGTASARQQSASLQEQARERTTRALQQGEERNRRAEP